MSKLREILLLTGNLHDNKAFSSKSVKKIAKRLCFTARKYGKKVAYLLLGFIQYVKRNIMRIMLHKERGKYENS